MARDFSKSISNGLALGVGGINGLVSGASAITIACWVQFDSFSNSATTNNRLVSEYGTLTTSSLMLNVGAVTPVFKVNARSQPADSLQTLSGTTTITTGVWWHFAGVINFGAGTIQPYVNGVAEGGGAATFGSSTYAPGSPTGQASIGGPWTATAPISANDQIDGRMAEVAIWRGALTAGEIAGLAARGGPTRIRMPVMYHRLDGAGSQECNFVGPSPIGTILGSLPAAAHPPVAAPFGGGDDGMPYAVTAPTGRTLAASPGAFVLAGQDAGTLYSRRLTSDAGAFALAGQPAGLLYSRRLTSDVGAFLLTGNQAGLGKTGQYTLVAAPGAYVLAGQDAGLQRARVMTATAGAFVLAGIDAAFVRTVVYTLTAFPGAFELDGQDVELAYQALPTEAPPSRFPELSGLWDVATPQFLRPDADAGRWEPSAPEVAGVFSPYGEQFQRYRLDADPGAFLVAGQSVEFVSGGDRLMVAAKGSVALTGKAALLIRKAPRAIVAAAGAFVMAGNPALFPRSSVKELDATVGVFAMAGNPATLTYFPQRRIAGTGGAVAVAGKAANLVLFPPAGVRVLPADPGTFAAAGRAALLRYDTGTAAAGLDLLGMV